MDKAAKVAADAAHKTEEAVAQAQQQARAAAEAAASAKIRQQSDAFAQQSIASFTATFEKAGKAAGDAAKGGIQAAIQGFTALRGAIFGVIGGVTAFIGIGSSIIAVLNAKSEAARKAAESVLALRVEMAKLEQATNTTGGTVDNPAAMNEKEIAKLRDDLRMKSMELATQLFKRGLDAAAKAETEANDKRDRELAALQEQAASARVAAQDREREDGIRNGIQAIKAIQAAQLDSMLDGEDKIRREGERTIEDLERKRVASVDTVYQAEIDAAIDGANRVTAYRIAKFKEEADKRAAEEDKRYRERMDRAAKEAEAFNAAMDRAVDGAQKRIADLFKSDEIVVAIENLAEVVSAIRTHAARIGSGD